jgi:hypothetical protein
MLGNGQVRFGGRVGETDRRQRRHRAPARPDPRHLWREARFWSSRDALAPEFVQDGRDQLAGDLRLLATRAEDDKFVCILHQLPQPLPAACHASSRTCWAPFASNGEIGDPCRVPASIADTRRCLRLAIPG